MVEGLGSRFTVTVAVVACLRNPAGHHVQELYEADQAVAISVELGHLD